MKKYGFVFNAARCNGCGACVIACKEEKALPDGVWLRKRYENVHTAAFLTMSCNHCEDPVCVKVCPVHAYKQDPDGLVIQDHAKCIGCGACVATCKNGSAMLFVAARVSSLAKLPQGRVEGARRAKAMVAKMDELGFGACTNTGACEAECPKGISIAHIARLNREFLSAKLKD